MNFIHRSSSDWSKQSYMIFTTVKYPTTDPAHQHTNNALLTLQQCNPWPHVANCHISISQLLWLWCHSHYGVSCCIAAPILIMTSFATEPATPTIMGVCYGHFTTF